jgi:hypothetical protein
MSNLSAAQTRALLLKVFQRPSFCSNSRSALASLLDVLFFNKQACFPIQDRFADPGGIEAYGGNAQGMCFDKDGRLTFRISVAGSHTRHAEYARTIQPIEYGVSGFRIGKGT